MENTTLKIAAGLSLKFPMEVKSVLSITRKDKTVEVMILAKTEDNSAIYEEAYSLAKQAKTNITVFDSEEFFDRIMNNDIEALGKLMIYEVCCDETRFITPLKKLVDLGKVFGQKEPLEIATKARNRFARIEMLKHDAIKNLYGAIITSANAALLSRGYSIPKINELPEHLKSCFANHDLLEKKYVKICDRIIEAYKNSQDDKATELWEFSQLSYETEMFVERMKTLIR